MPGRACPAGTAAVGHATRQHESRFGDAIIRKQAFRIRRAVGLVDLRDIAGTEYALLFGEVDGVPDHPGAFAGTEVHEVGKRGIDRDVFLRTKQLGQVRVVARLTRLGERLVDHRLEACVAEVTRVGAAALLAEPHGDAQLAVVLDEVRGDRRVGPSGARPFTAGQVHFHRVGGGHVEDLVDEFLGLLSCIHEWRAGWVRLLALNAGTAGTGSNLQAVSRNGNHFFQLRLRQAAPPTPPPFSAEEKCERKDPPSRSHRVPRFYARHRGKR